MTAPAPHAREVIVDPADDHPEGAADGPVVRAAAPAGAGGSAAGNAAPPQGAHLAPGHVSRVPTHDPAPAGADILVEADPARWAGQFTPSPADPPLTEAAVPYLPRGVRLATDRVRGLRVLQAPERAMQLDPVGEAILSALDGRPWGAILDGLAAAYGAPRAQVAEDATAFLQGLIDRRMIFVRLP